MKIKYLGVIGITCSLILFGVIIRRYRTRKNTIDNDYIDIPLYCSNETCDLESKFLSNAEGELINYQINNKTEQIEDSEEHIYLDTDICPDINTEQNTEQTTDENKPDETQLLDISKSNINDIEMEK